MKVLNNDYISIKPIESIKESENINKTKECTKMVKSTERKHINANSNINNIYTYIPLSSEVTSHSHAMIVKNINVNIQTQVIPALLDIYFCSFCGEASYVDSMCFHCHSKLEKKVFELQYNENDSFDISLKFCPVAFQVKIYEVYAIENEIKKNHCNCNITGVQDSVFNELEWVNIIEYIKRETETDYSLFEIGIICNYSSLYCNCSKVYDIFHKISKDKFKPISEIEELFDCRNTYYDVFHKISKNIKVDSSRINEIKEILELFKSYIIDKKKCND